MEEHAVLVLRLEEGAQAQLQAAPIEPGGIHHMVRHFPQRGHGRHLLPDRAGKVAAPGVQGVAMPGLLVAVDDHLLRGFQEQHLKGQVPAQQADMLRQIADVPAAPDVAHQGHPVIFPLRRHHQLHKAVQQLRGQIVHAEEAHILQDARRLALARAAEPRDQHKFFHSILISGSRRTPVRSRTACRTSSNSFLTSEAVAPPRFTTKPACF